MSGRGKAWQTLRIALLYATVLSTYAVVVTLVTEGRALAKYGPEVSLWGVFLMYYGAAIAGTLLVELLRPVSGTLIGSMLLGFLIASVGGFLLLLTILPPEQWRDVLPLATLLFALAVGPGCGAINWYYDRHH